MRVAKFIPRKNWIVVGSDDMLIRVYNMHSSEKIHQMDGHSDYIRCLLVHPTKNVILSGSDDSTIKMWDWDRNWKCVGTFEGHSHYVMSLAFNPKDPNMFASASLDRTIKIWNLSGSTMQAYFTLEGHEKGVNTVEFYGGVDRPYIVSGADDNTVRVWDYQTKGCIKVMEGHSSNISCVLFHPELPLLLSGSEDSTIKIWNSNSFKLQNTLNFGLERIWHLTAKSASNSHVDLAIACDEGSAIFQIGKGEPPFTMDDSGKVAWTRKSEVFITNLRNIASLNESNSAHGNKSVNASASGNDKNSPSSSISNFTDIKDGMEITLNLEITELGQCEIFPQWIGYNSNGRFIAICGDGEWSIYSSLAFRNKSFGKGMEFAWSLTGDFAIKDSSSLIKIYHDFTESLSIKQPIEHLFGGMLLGVSTPGNQLCFYDWKTGSLIRAIDIMASKVTWSPNGSKVAIVSEGGGSTFILSYNQSAKNEDSIFELIEEINEQMDSCCWAGEVLFYFSSSSRKIAYWIGGGSYQLGIHDHNLYIVGLFEGRIILIDKELHLYTYSIPQIILEYKLAVLKGEANGERASFLLSKIPQNYKSHVALFLQSHGLPELALKIATDPEQKYELALSLNKLDVAYEIAQEEGSQYKWRQIGDYALRDWKVSLAENCYWKAVDYNSLLLIYSASGNNEGLLRLAEASKESNQLNIAFTCYFAIGKREECLDLLLASKRYAEAVIFSRSYLPNHLCDLVGKWKMKEIRNSKIANIIADPMSNPNLFSELENSISLLAQQQQSSSNYPLSNVSNLSFSHGSQGMGMGGLDHNEDSMGMGKDNNFTLNFGNSSGRTRGLSTTSSGPSTSIASTTSSSMISPSNASNSNTVNSNSIGTSGGMGYNNSSSFPYDAFSDHMSMEVNTAGTGSVRVEEVDELLYNSDGNHNVEIGELTTNMNAMGLSRRGSIMKSSNEMIKDESSLPSNMIPNADIEIPSNSDEIYAEPEFQDSISTENLDSSLELETNLGMTRKENKKIFKFKEKEKREEYFNEVDEDEQNGWNN